MKTIWLCVFPTRLVEWKGDYFLMILFKYLLDISTGFSDLAIQLLVFSMIKWYEDSLKVHKLTQKQGNWELRSAEQLTVLSLHRWVIMMGTLCLIRKSLVSITGKKKVQFVCYKHDTEIIGCGKAMLHPTHPFSCKINLNLFIFAVMQ